MGFGGLMMSLAPNYWALLPFVGLLPLVLVLQRCIRCILNSYRRSPVEHALDGINLHGQLIHSPNSLCLVHCPNVWMESSFLRNGSFHLYASSFICSGLRSICLLIVAWIPALGYLPESPRYLLVAGYPDHASHVLERIATMNGTSIPNGTSLKLPSTNDSSNEPATKAGVLSQFVRCHLVD